MQVSFGTTLVATLFLALGVCTSVVPTWAEWIALLLMIGAGIPHGSFDLRIAQLKWRNDRASRKGIAIGYVACVIGMSALCIVAPLLGLSLFLLISAVHFSEGEAHAVTPQDFFRGALTGVGAILLPIGLHPNEARAYMGFFVPQQVFDAMQGIVQGCAYTVTSVLAALLIYDLFISPKARRAITIERLICLVGWVLLPPLAGFAVWFIGRHSRQHMEVCQGMFAANRFGIPLDFAVISLVAIAGLAPFTLLFDLSDINQLFAASISLIAGLTLPHMIVSHDLRRIIAAAPRHH